VHFTVPQNEFKYVRGSKSASQDDAESTSTCGSGWTLTACRCQRGAACDGTYISWGTTCRAFNGVHQGGAIAEAECVRNTMASSSTSTAALAVSDVASSGWNTNPSVSCPSGYTLTGCSCYSPWRGCTTNNDGAQGTINGNTCSVQGSSVQANARCVKDIKVMAVSSSGWSGSGDDNAKEVDCPTGFKIRGCQCADASVCDGARTSGSNRCSVWNGNGGSGARARAFCAKDDRNSLGVSSSTSGWHNGAASASCPVGSVVTGCTCYSSWAGCSNSHGGMGTDGSISGQTCTVSGGLVSATATCMTGTL